MYACGSSGDTKAAAEGAAASVDAGIAYGSWATHWTAVVRGVAIGSVAEWARRSAIAGGLRGGVVVAFELGVVALCIPGVWVNIGDTLPPPQPNFSCDRAHNDFCDTMVDSGVRPL